MTAERHGESDADGEAQRHHFADARRDAAA